MTKIRIHPRPVEAVEALSNPLPTILQTPCGLALIEIQGTLNSTVSHEDEDEQSALSIGKLAFPLYTPGDTSGDTSWQKRVHLFVGDNQRLTGELKKLPNPVAVLQRRLDTVEDLEVAAIVHYKIMFSHRPEPFGVLAAQ